MAERRTNKERRKSVREIMEDHSKSDRDNFENIGKSLEDIKVYMEEDKIFKEQDKVFKENLTWLSDISKGTKLLKKPSLWFVAFIIGLVTLIGGLKTLTVWVLRLTFPK